MKMELNNLFGLVIVLSAILIIVWLYMENGETVQVTKGTERLKNVIRETEPSEPHEPSVDMVDFNHDDPKFSKYSRRFSDAAGMDGSDYYYENDIMYRQGVAGEKQGASLFESEYGLPDTRGNQTQPFNPESRWFDIPSGRMQGSVESAELPVGGSSVTAEVMADRQAAALFSGFNSAEHYYNNQLENSIRTGLHAWMKKEPYTNLTGMSQSDALFG